MQTLHFCKSGKANKIDIPPLSVLYYIYGLIQTGFLCLFYGDFQMGYNPRRHRLPVCNAFGILLVDKPADWTSFDVVNFVRGRFNLPKVGHCGTLDPAATGLLVLTIGKFTSFSSRFAGDDKTYEATLKLGITTDSYDMEGNITSQCDASHLDDESVRNAILSFTGEQKQLPPMVSAVKVGGKKLYELARKGIEIEREPRDIFIENIDITRCANPEYDFTVKCSKGTYIRTLCHDIGQKLGVGGTLSALRRTQSGRFTIENALTIEKIKEMEQQDIADYLAAHLVKLAGASE